MNLELQEPYPKQIEFFKATTTYVAYGGARGGGKSWAGRMKMILLALNKPRNTNIIIKKNIKRIKRKSCSTITKNIKM